MDGGQLRVAINAHLVSFEQTYRNAGVSRYTYTLLDGLSRDASPQHYTVFVNRAAVGTAAVEAVTASGRIEVVAGSTLARRPLQRVLWEQTRLPAELRRAHVDVFHSPVNVLPLRLPCPSVVTILDLAFIHYPQYFRPARRMYQRAFTSRSAQRATRIVTIAESTKRDLLERFGAASERVRVIYPAIDADYQRVNDPDARASFRARHHLPERYILYLGTLEPRKNLLTLVEAYARLRALAPDAPPLILAGAKGWYYQAVFEQVRSLGLERSVTFAGYVSREDQPLWYSCADLFVYPSLFEGFGLPVVEALACGTPTVTSNVSSLPEAGGDVALLVDPGSQDALAHAMHGVLSDPASRPRTEEAGPLWARRFSPARMAAEYADIYREATEAGNVGAGKRGR